MSTFDKREEGFEKKFALDEETKFKAEARRNKLLGLWAAEKLGKTGDDAAAYAKEVVAADFEEAGDTDVLRKVAGDLASKGVSELDIRKKMDELVAVAVAQIKAGQ
ncbi:putative purine biosynthesis protein [Bradyrhizobiaceae bacterium SG-6C]|nr:putative purine biosynthesis protein [Bradyrhizobiaceae bacterium SG-6C]